MTTATTTAALVASTVGALLLLLLLVRCADPLVSIAFVAAVAAGGVVLFVRSQGDDGNSDGDDGGAKGDSDSAADSDGGDDGGAKGDSDGGATHPNAELVQTVPATQDDVNAVVARTYCDPRTPQADPQFQPNACRTPVGVDPDDEVAIGMAALRKPFDERTWFRDRDAMIGARNMMMGDQRPKNLPSVARTNFERSVFGSVRQTRYARPLDPSTLPQFKQNAFF